MNRDEVASALSSKFDELSKSRAIQLLKAIDEIIVDGLKKEGQVDLAGGRFYVRAVKAREARSVIGFDGEPHKVNPKPATFTIKYKPFSAIRKKLTK